MWKYFQLLLSQSKPQRTERSAAFPGAFHLLVRYYIRVVIGCTTFQKIPKTKLVVINWQTNLRGPAKCQASENFTRNPIPAHGYQRTYCWRGGWESVFSVLEILSRHGINTNNLYNQQKYMSHTITILLSLWLYPG